MRFSKRHELALPVVLMLSATFLAVSALAQPRVETDWNATVEAARREGVVKCACPPRRDFALAFKRGFEKAYPGITLEITAASLPSFPIRVEKEQAAGMYLWDVYTFGPGSGIFALKRKGGLESFWDYMVRPQVLDDSAWIGGLRSRFLDVEQKYIFAIFFSVSTSTVNRNVLPKADLSTFEDVLNPAYKGKMVSVDPRRGGSGESLAAAVYRKYGRDGLKKLFVDQEVLFVKGNVELAEQVLRGDRPISLTGVSSDARIRYQKAGVKLNLQDFVIEDVARAGTNGSSPAIFKNPPHPNATKVFINWLLSKEGEAFISKVRGEPAARNDVPMVNPEHAPKAGVDYMFAHKEEAMQKYLAPAQQVLRELFP